MIQEIDGISFHLREYQDFSWLKNYGKVFSCIDQTGSGCIHFGIEKNGKKYFFKIAGAKTLYAEISQEESILILKDAAEKYLAIKNECLIQYVDSFAYQEFFVIIFEFAVGECLFDHWNFDFYMRDKTRITPKQKFMRLSISKRLVVVKKLCSFFRAVIEAGYVAVDFYDSSIIYDFNTDEVTFCDIDLFRKAPTKNELGEHYFGTKRLKAPEECILGSPIDELTNEFTLGAIVFDMFSKVSNHEERYRVGHFIANKRSEFELSERTYEVLKKATALDRRERYLSIAAFEDAFYQSVVDI